MLIMGRLAVVLLPQGLYIQKGACIVVCTTACVIRCMEHMWAKLAGFWLKKIRMSTTEEPWVILRASTEGGDLLRFVCCKACVEAPAFVG